jgi:CHASE3 domain sensor protein
MKKLKLSVRIGLGFGVLIAITLLLGSVAMWNMNNTSHNAAIMAEHNVPEVTVANEVERAAMLTMLEMRGYGLTGTTNYLQAGFKNLNDVKQHIAAARNLAANSDALTGLKTAAEKAGAKLTEYERLVQETIDKNKDMGLSWAKMTENDQALLKAGQNFLDDQYKAFAEETQANASMEKIRQRNLKIKLANDILEAGRAVRLAAWRAQAERDPKLIQDAQKQFDIIKAKLEEAKPITTRAANLQQIAECQKGVEGCQSAMNDWLAHWAARDASSSKRAETGYAVMAEAKKVAIQGLEDTKAIATRSVNTMAMASTILGFGLIIALAIGLAIALYMTRSISKPIKLIAEVLTSGAEQAASAACQVASASQSLAEGASEQAASLEETSSSLEEMSSMTKRNAESAQKAKELADQARDAAEMGALEVQSMSESMGGISASSDEMRKAMDGVKTANDEVAKIIKTIDEIAFQTNILALNAAVEAARAGESGMGFAVVADEVRNLAQKSAQAARETAAKIEGAIQKTEFGVHVSEKVVEKIESVLAQSKKVRDSLCVIVNKARDVDNLVGEIATASSEQSHGINQVNTAVTQMDKVTQSNAANAEESASAAEELNAQAKSLTDIVLQLNQLVDGKSPGNVAGKSMPMRTPKTPMTHEAVASIRKGPVIASNRQAINRHAKSAPHVKDQAINAFESSQEGDFKDF